MVNKVLKLITFAFKQTFTQLEDLENLPRLAQPSRAEYRMLEIQPLAVHILYTSCLHITNRAGLQFHVLWY